MSAKDQRSSPAAATEAAVDERPTMAGLRTISTRLESPPTGDDTAAERRRQAQELVAAAGGREGIKRLHAEFLVRLHPASNDWGATEGLRVTQEALELATRPG